MKIVLVFLNVFFVMLISCGDNQASTETSNSDNENNKTKITAKAIENFDYSDYALSSNAEGIVENWEKYQELAIQVDYLKKADLSFFNGDKELLKKFITDLKAKIPDTLQTNPIISRTVIIETSLLRLNENLTLDNIDAELKLESVKEVIVSFSNLNYQINKKLINDKYAKIKSEY